MNLAQTIAITEIMRIYDIVEIEDSPITRAVVATASNGTQFVIYEFGDFDAFNEEAARARVRLPQL